MNNLLQLRVQRLGIRANWPPWLPYRPAWHDATPDKSRTGNAEPTLYKARGTKAFPRYQNVQLSPSASLACPLGIVSGLQSQR